MAPSSSSALFKASSVIFQLLIIHLICSSTVFADRAGPTTSIHHLPVNPETMKRVNHRSPESVTSFRYRVSAFGFLPKATKVPPSGPSKRHNAVVDSIPNN
ncbi:hypothetical protein SAY86_002596 [Trapa natans]|uniref:Uncharacterized protein n=1 Tax=Trapa natans TaxID=22666 RepID=A0AAN7LFY2_TRANT|nr:hypothetical protein SAY86_002596 [Trapa natans]